MSRLEIDRDDDTTCRVCGRVVHRPVPVCFCCRVLAGQLRLPLVPVAVAVEYRVGDRTHRLLRGYKDAPAAEGRAVCRRELADLLAAWLGSDGRSAGRRVCGPWTVVTAVPSSCRPGHPPVEALIAEVPFLAARHRRLLIRGPGTTDHLLADRSGFAVAPGIERGWLAGRQVLVVDDSTTTGARGQSAAAALRLAGARVAGVLAVGRAHPTSGGGTGQPERAPGGLGDCVLRPDQEVTAQARTRRRGGEPAVVAGQVGERNDAPAPSALHAVPLGRFDPVLHQGTAQTRTGGGR